MSKLQQARDTIVLLAILVEGGLVVGAILLGWVLEHHPLSHCSFDVAGLLWGVAGTIPLLLAFALLDRWPIGPFKELKEFSEKTVRPMLAPCTTADLVGISCLAGLGEEMLFRGVIQDGLVAAQLPFWLALWITSVAFGLVHAVTPAYAVVATVMGAFLGWLYHASGNLLAPIVTHGLYDLVVLLYMLRGPGAPEVREEDYEGEDEDEQYEPEEQ